MSKMSTRYYQKTKKGFEKRHDKGVRIFLKKKKKKRRKYYCKPNKSLSENQKQRLVEYRRNDYIILENNG